MYLEAHSFSYGFKKFCIKSGCQCSQKWSVSKIRRRSMSLAIEVSASNSSITWLGDLGNPKNQKHNSIHYIVKTVITAYCLLVDICVLSFHQSRAKGNLLNGLFFSAEIFSGTCQSSKFDMYQRKLSPMIFHQI